MAGEFRNQKDRKTGPQVNREMGKCFHDIEARINLPCALYDLGFFFIKAGNICESIKYYAKAVKKSQDQKTLLSGFSPLCHFIRNTSDMEIRIVFTKLMQIAFSLFPPVQGANGTYPDNLITRAFSNSSAGDPQSPEFERPLLIVSGGCGNLENQYEKDLETLREKLKAFNGTIVSGGTITGIARIVGDLQEHKKELDTIGYVPDTNSASIRGLLDQRYSRIRATGGRDFSPLEHLTFWTDYLSKGKSPRMVKLTGFNGGIISSCEYAIGLMLGARVGIVRNSGREADAALADPLWLEYLNNRRDYQSDTDNLFPLDLGNNDIELFIQCPL